MIIVLDNIRSLFNVGSIFRTADAVGAKKIYLCGITPTPEDRFGRIRPQLAKVSLGAEKTVAWEYVKSTSKLIDMLKKPKSRSELCSATGEKYKIFVVEQDKRSVPYFKLKLKKSELEKIALVFGNEVDGVSKNILKKADKILEIPMRGAMVRQAHHPRCSHRGKESLNVSVSAGIVMFHIKYLI